MQLTILMCCVYAGHALRSENQGVFEIIKFDHSNFSPWFGFEDTPESLETNDAKDDAYAERVAKRNDFGINCKKEKPPSFKNTPNTMQVFVGGFLGHRMELKCPHRKGCPK